MKLIKKRKILLSTFCRFFRKFVAFFIGTIIFWILLRGAVLADEHKSKKTNFSYYNYCYNYIKKNTFMVAGLLGASTATLVYFLNYDRINACYNSLFNKVSFEKLYMLQHDMLNFSSYYTPTIDCQRVKYVNNEIDFLFYKRIIENFNFRYTELLPVMAKDEFQKMLTDLILVQTADLTENVFTKCIKTN